MRIALLLAGVLTACGTAGPERGASFSGVRTARVFAAPVEEVWGAALATARALELGGAAHTPQASLALRNVLPMRERLTIRAEIRPGPVPGPERGAATEGLEVTLAETELGVEVHVMPLTLGPGGGDAARRLARVFLEELAVRLGAVQGGAGF